MSNNSLTQQCILMLSRDDIKDEFKKLIWPVIFFFLNEIKSYIYFMMMFLIITFLMILSILVILIQIVRNKSYLVQEKILR